MYSFFVKVFFFSVDIKDVMHRKLKLGAIQHEAKKSVACAQLRLRNSGLKNLAVKTQCKVQFCVFIYPFICASLYLFPGY